MTPLVERLPWDSAFFGFPIVRVDPAALATSTLAATLQRCDAQGVRCAYLQLDAGAGAASERAQTHGFVLRDVRLELDRPLATGSRSSHSAPVRPARRAQQPALEALARRAIVGSRFLADPNFPAERCRELYVAFLRRGLGDDPQRFTLSDEAAGGFVVCHRDVQREAGTIELIAVDDAQRGRCLGRALVAGAALACANAGLHTLEVATQASNIAAQRLYQGCDFRTRRAALWFHRWNPIAPAES
jgi:dTDP-4-amino-4,6-dideoxy-D-galactose acyltransferase